MITNFPHINLNWSLKETSLSPFLLSFPDSYSKYLSFHDECGPDSSFTTLHHFLVLQKRDGLLPPIQDMGKSDSPYFGGF